jgi:hypothetical protein
VCPSVRHGRSAEVIWPRDTRGYISGPRALEARTRRSLWAPAMALATCTNTSFLGGLYKIKQQMGTYIQWPAVSQPAWRHCLSSHHGGSRVWNWLLTFSSLARGAASKLKIFWQLMDGALVEAQLWAHFFFIHNMHILLTSNTAQIPKKKGR